MKCLSFLGWLGWRFGRLIAGLAIMAIAIFVIAASSPMMFYMTGCGADIGKFFEAGVVMAFGPDGRDREIG